MADLVVLSQSSLLLPKFRSHSPTLGLPPLRYSSPSCFSQRSVFHSLTGTIRANSSANPLSRKIPISRVSSSSNSPNSAFPPGTGGGDGLGGGGNNNGGGGGGKEESGGGSGDGKKMSMSQKLTLAYAALVGAGGVMGYLKGGSQKSLVAGGISALALCLVYGQLASRPVLASSLGLGVSAALLGVMGSRFKSSGKVFPAGVVSLASLVMAGGYLHGIMRSLH
ncbi:protein FATTY ACID EXPORT 2, chloroplastic-like [Malania oleifera]|uniref:protein FATTY ACID EXPORT 2, chloroplastic-like n=1 Tax=Malania oleifera TaxID=397392 RepID=UPI0025ADF233|nr:protein FATTY ACID EXPORT 2, chloroplastic-like [Malania oleifera]